MLTPDDVALLTSPPGQAGVLRAAQLIGGDPVTTAAALRKEVSDPHLAALALTQAELHTNEDVTLPILTRDGLEAGSNPLVATVRAELLRNLGARRVLDLTAGLGFDTAAFIASGCDVTAVERDPGIAAALAVNVPGATVRCETAQDVDTSGFDAVFIDPARRDLAAASDGTRALPERDPERWSPPLSWALNVPRAVIKVAPGIDRTLIPEGWHAMWISVHRKLHEAMLLSPELNPENLARSAWVLPEHAVFSSPHQTSEPIPVVDVGAFLIEPDDAIIRAGLVSDLGRELGAGLIDANVAWLSADEERQSPFARTYRVIEVLPNKVKPLRAALIERGFGNVVVKTRAVATTPEELRRSLKLPGGPIATLVVTRARNVGITLLVEVCPQVQQ